MEFRLNGNYVEGGGQGIGYDEKRRVLGVRRRLGNVPAKSDARVISGRVASL